MGGRGGGSGRRKWPWFAVVVSALILATSWTVSGSSAVAQTTSELKAFDSHISHIVFVVLENHAYDSYFGEYCLTLGKYCRSVGDGLPAGLCVPENPASVGGPCIRPFNFTDAQLAPPDMNHDWNSTHTSINSGRMNGFFGAEGGTPETFGHYNGSTAPVYWDLAEEYGLADNFFSSAASYSLPNHWFAVSATAPNVSEQLFPAANAIQVRHEYLNESNQTNSIESDLLNSSSVSWKYYDWALPNYTKAITNGGTSATAGLAYDLWNPLAARAASYTSSVKTHFVSDFEFNGDARNGTLPNLSWVIPPVLYSDHPPYNITAGQSYVASLIDSVEASPEWNSTAVFITWDEYGGFYDHVAPPTLDAYGAGLRVPLLAIGPWVRQGFIDHSAMNFDSVLHLMELRFGLPCLGARDCNATVPMALFNFNQTARAPILIPTYANASYPMPLQSSGKLPPFDPLLIPTVPFAPGPAPDDAIFAEGGIG